MGVSEAAERLRHDLAKAIRFSAPEVPETETEALRARLHADVATTRRDASSSQSAAEVFDAWRREEGRHFRGALASRVDDIAGAIEEIRGLTDRLSSLARPELERLDALTRRVASECRTLAGEARRDSRR
ncbi:MAG TPA: hypothetical protein VGK26_10740 [Thermoanaerobaculia bacterium]|jgi:uncharacterized protein YicC (UPF0701 family)